MSWTASWADCADWFDAYAADGAYSWARFFPGLLRRLCARESGRGLYAHRWATTVVVSRFGVHPDWAVGPKVELLALPGPRLEVTAFAAYGRRLECITLPVPVDLDKLDEWFRYVAGETERVKG